MRRCKYQGCDRAHYARGWCSKHYQMWRKYGDPYLARPRTHGMSVKERLEFYGWDVTESGCWEWRGGRTTKGYGTVYDGTETQHCHREAFKVWVGPIPEGHVVRHKCDNPPCINPEHLETGTQGDNVRDMIERGRMAVGEKRPTAKLTVRDVVDIRWAYSIGAEISDLSAVYGVAWSAIQSVVERRTWKHVS